jgi:uncharacterized protein YecE (DUF72 family)
VAALGRLAVGCSGWQYKHWRGDLYPPDLPQSRWFDHYATIFDTVEINNTFYRLPEAETFSAWAERAPRGFIYAVKASRYLTHLRKLKDPADPLDRLLSRAARLGPHLGPVLYQLPPGWHVDIPRLEQFLQALPREVRHVVEFRDPSWYVADTLERLEAHGVSHCLHDRQGAAPERRQTGPFVYVRFHGPSGAYAGGYSARRLSEWSEWLHGCRRQGLDVYAYFNNDVGGHAPRDALALRGMLEERV